MSELTKQQTIVDWIFSQLPDKYTMTPHGFDVYIIAKAMERDKSIQFALDCQEMFKDQIIEQYNKTFESDAPNFVDNS
jgi:hypothetical protein